MLFFSWNKIESRGGRCIPVQCDHTKDDEIQKLFDQVKNEQNGQLDVLVNNAYAAVTVGPFNQNYLHFYSIFHHFAII